MYNARAIASKTTLISVLMCGAMSAAPVTGDLSTYRGFHFGTNPAVVAKAVGVSMSEVKIVHSRPALIQQLTWRPRNQGPTTQPESVSDIIFSFFNGELYRIVVQYDRYEIEGLAVDDIVEAVSLTYGPSAKPSAPAKAARETYGDQEDAVAHWQDTEYYFDLMRSSYGPTFKLI